MTRIERFGWRGAVEPGIGRVVSAHGDYYHLVCNEAEGEILARKKKSAFGRMKTAAPDDMKGAKKSELQASEPLKPILLYMYSPAEYLNPRQRLSHLKSLQAGRIKSMYTLSRTARRMPKSPVNL